MAAQEALPSETLATHSFLVPNQNVTVPVGALPDDVTVAENFTSWRVLAVLGLAAAAVFDECLGVAGLLTVRVAVSVDGNA